MYIVYRKDELRGDPTWKAEALKKENIEVIYNTMVLGFKGNDKLEGIKLSKEYNGSDILNVDGLFIEIGSEPNKDLAQKIGIKTDGKGYIVVDQAQKTNIEGIWAAGDCTTNSNGFRQIATAISEGAIAANDIFKTINR